MYRKLTISIIILTKNSEATIRRCLNPILSSRLGDELFRIMEVIVVDGGSSDNTLTLVDRYMSRSPLPIRMLYNIKGRGYARMVGVLQAKGDLIAFIDSDVRIALDWFEKLVPYFNDPGVGSVSDIAVLETTDKVITMLENYATVLYWKYHAPTYRPDMMTTGHSIWRRRAIIRAGNFNPVFHSTEDGYMSRRLFLQGWKLVIVPAVNSYHAPSRDTLGKVIKWQFEHGFWEGAAYEFLGMNGLGIGSFGVLAPLASLIKSTLRACLTERTPLYILGFAYLLFRSLVRKVGELKARLSVVNNSRVLARVLKSCNVRGS